MLRKANAGTGPDKFEWAASYYGLSTSFILFGVGCCKVAAFADIWFLHIIPQVALGCIAVMMAFVLHGNMTVGDDLLPPVIFGIAAIIAAATWPAGKSKSA